MEQPVSVTREDRELLAAYARAGDQDAFRILVERHHRLVFSVCYQALNRNQASADDATQSVFIILARKAVHINGQNLPNWLFKTSRYVVQGMQRKEWRLKRRERLVAQQAPIAAEDQIADLAEQDKLGQILQGAITRLPALQREAVLLCYFDGLDPRHAATLLGCESQTVRMRLHHALVSLRERLSRNRAIAGLLSAAAVEGLLAQTTSAAIPAGLVARCHTAATGASAAGAATAAVQMANQFLRHAALKTAATIGVSIIAAGSLTVGGITLYSALGPGAGEAQTPTPAVVAAPALSHVPPVPPALDPPPPASAPAPVEPPESPAPLPPAPPIPPARSARSTDAALVWEPAKAYPSSSTQGDATRPEDQVNRKWDLFPEDK